MPAIAQMVKPFLSGSRLKRPESGKRSGCIEGIKLCQQALTATEVDTVAAMMVKGWRIMKLAIAVILCAVAVSAYGNPTENPTELYQVGRAIQQASQQFGQSIQQCYYKQQLPGLQLVQNGGINRHPQLAPDGSWVGGHPQLAPDGTWVGGKPDLAPDGTWTGGRSQLAPDGSWVGGKPQLAPDGTWVGGKPELAPNGEWVGVEK